MRAYIENDDDITPYIEIDIYENGELIEANGFPCKPLPWRMELDNFDVKMMSKDGGKNDNDR